MLRLRPSGRGQRGVSAALVLLRRFWWAVPLLGAIAWSGVLKVQLSSARTDLADYKAAQAAVVADQRAQIIQLQQARQAASERATRAFLEGKRHAELEFAPVNKALNDLRQRWMADQRLRNGAADGGDGVPAAAIPARDLDGTACTDQPGRIVAAADRVIADLRACEVEVRRLKELQAWAASLADERKPAK